MNLYEHDRYITTKENVLQKIQQYGIAIVPHVLNEGECDQMRDGAFDYL